MRERPDVTLDRLYIAVSGTLPPGLDSAQAVHAAFQFAHRHPDLTQAWLRDSRYLVIVSVPDEVALIRLSSRALDAGLIIETWHEPDRGNETTAVALEPGDAARRLCASYPLLGRREMALAE